MVRNGLRNLKEEIKKMDEEEKETKKPNKIASLVKMILEFKNENQERKGLKILTSDQMINRLAISLAKLKAKNNSEKLKTKQNNKTTTVFFVLFKEVNQSHTKQFNQYSPEMETIFMNAENSKTNDPHRFRLPVAVKLNLKGHNKSLVLPNLSI